jgi:hypothetical protein
MNNNEQRTRTTKNNERTTRRIITSMKSTLLKFMPLEALSSWNKIKKIGEGVGGAGEYESDDTAGGDDLDQATRNTTTNRTIGAETTIKTRSRDRSGIEKMFRRAAPSASRHKATTRCS